MATAGFEKSLADTSGSSVSLSAIVQTGMENEGYTTTPGDQILAFYYHYDVNLKNTVLYTDVSDEQSEQRYSQILPSASCGSGHVVPSKLDGIAMKQLKRFMDTAVSNAGQYPRAKGGYVLVIKHLQTPGDDNIYWCSMRDGRE